jgi:hypothetical protein
MSLSVSVMSFENEIVRFIKTKEEREREIITICIIHYRSIKEEVVYLSAVSFDKSKNDFVCLYC